VATQIQDDGFHEIQLNGKQLVFLFMAATVVSVVIFLCGVLVGRGVRAERGAGTDVSTTAANAVEEPTPPPSAQKQAPNPANDPTVAAPPAPVDDVSYPERLEKRNAPPEHLKPVADPPKAAAPPVARQAPAPPPPAPKEPPKETPRATTAQLPTAAEPGGQGYAVQIAALNVRSEADAIARRLSSKGYQAYVLAPPSGTPSVYRVRVGKFPTRREAESMAARLQREEQFKPWITR